MTQELYDGTDRNRQVQWLRNEADTISYYGGFTDATPEDAKDFVELWALAKWHNDEPKPHWFDDADKQLLIQFVAELL